MSLCIYDSNKTCDNCNDCRCDFDKNKICDNCGKCLQGDNFETRAVKIDKVISDDSKEYKDYLDNDNIEDTTDNALLDDDYTIDDIDTQENEDNKDIKVEYIDDIDGLSEILNDEKKFDNVMYEQFPGFIKIKSNNK